MFRGLTAEVELAELASSRASSTFDTTLGCAVLECHTQSGTSGHTF